MLKGVKESYSVECINFKLEFFYGNLYFSSLEYKENYILPSRHGNVSKQNMFRNTKSCIEEKL